MLNSGGSPETVIVAEGLATTLSAQQMQPDALAVVALDAGNLPAVAAVLREKYPDARIIIAADNDIHALSDGQTTQKPNTGKLAAEQAAKAVNGWVALPPTEEKADWNDYHQLHGLEAATKALSIHCISQGKYARSA